MIVVEEENIACHPSNLAKEKLPNIQSGQMHFTVRRNFDFKNKLHESVSAFFKNKSTQNVRIDFY